MKVTLTIEVPDDFKKGDRTKCPIYAGFCPAHKWAGVKGLCSDKYCPLEIQEEKPVCNDCVLYDNCGYYRKDGECLRKF